NLETIRKSAIGITNKHFRDLPRKTPWNGKGGIISQCIIEDSERREGHSEAKRSGGLKLHNEMEQFEQSPITILEFRLPHHCTRYIISCAFVIDILPNEPIPDRGERSPCRIPPP